MNSMSPSNFDDFLAIARQQTEPQRLLIVLAKRELPEEHTAEQAEQFDRGNGGHLAPLASVDKQINEIANFKHFAEESHQVVGDWDVMFVAALMGAEQLPSIEETDHAIEEMLNSIRDGKVSSYLALDNAGLPLNLSAS